MGKRTSSTTQDTQRHSACGSLSPQQTSQQVSLQPSVPCPHKHRGQKFQQFYIHGFTYKVYRKSNMFVRCVIFVICISGFCFPVCIFIYYIYIWMEPFIKRGSADNDIWELSYIHQWGSSATQGSFMEHLDSSRIWSKWHNAKHIIICYQIIYDTVYSSSILSYSIIYYPVYSHECLEMTQYGFSNDAKKRAYYQLLSMTITINCI